MLLWDVRESMEQNHLNKMAEIKEKFKHKESYYVHVCVNWTNHSMEELKNTYIIRSDPPPKMFGSMLYLIDNKKGSEELKWALPMDVLVPEEYLDPHNSVASVARNAEDMKGAIVMS